MGYKTVEAADYQKRVFLLVFFIFSRIIWLGFTFVRIIKYFVRGYVHLKNENEYFMNI